MISRRKVSFIAVSGVLFVVSFLFLLLIFWIPHQKLSDETWLDSAAPEEMRDVAHSVLKLPFGNFHDAFLIMSREGDTDSVPYLIGALRKLEYFSGDTTSHTQQHGFEALNRITCHDLGFDAEKWRAWWMVNRGKAKHELLVQRFAAEGVPVSNPLSERFIRELIPYLADGKPYLAECAWQLARLLPEEKLAATCKKLLHSHSLQDRRGVVVCLSKLTGNESIDYLRLLARDPELEIRSFALEALNSLLRLRYSRLRDGAAIEDEFEHTKLRLARDITAVGIGEDRSRLYVGIEHNIQREPDAHLVALDAKDGKTAWSFKCPQEVSTAPVAMGGAVFFGSYDGVVYALRASTGELLWKKRTGDSVFSYIKTIVPLDDTLMVGRERRLYALNQTDGKTLWTFEADSEVDHLAYDQEHLYMLLRTDEGSRVVKMSLQGEALSARDLTQWGHSLSVMGNSLYIISSPRKAFWEGASLMALDAPSLTEIWRRELGSLRNYPQSPPAVSPKVVVAASDEKIWAFDRVSGTPLWTVNDEEDPDFFILGDEFFLSKDFRIESRDLMTGEVTRVYPGTSHGNREELVVSPGMLVATHEGELLLFNLSEGM